MNGLSRGLLDTIQHLTGIALVIAGGLRFGPICVGAGMGLIGATTFATLKRTDTEADRDVDK